MQSAYGGDIDACQRSARQAGTPKPWAAHVSSNLIIGRIDAATTSLGIKVKNALPEPAAA